MLFVAVLFICIVTNVGNICIVMLCYCYNEKKLALFTFEIKYKLKNILPPVAI